jgi:hypothetical protein
MMALTGAGILVASMATLMGMRPGAGQVAPRSEFVETTVAILITGGIGLGVTMVVSGLMWLWTP